MLVIVAVDVKKRKEKKFSHGEKRIFVSFPRLTIFVEGGRNEDAKKRGGRGEVRGGGRKK